LPRVAQERRFPQGWALQVPVLADGTPGGAGCRRQCLFYQT